MPRTRTKKVTAPRDRTTKAEYRVQVARALDAMREEVTKIRTEYDAEITRLTSREETLKAGLREPAEPAHESSTVATGIDLGAKLWDELQMAAKLGYTLILAPVVDGGRFDVVAEKGR